MRDAAVSMQFSGCLSSASASGLLTLLKGKSWLGAAWCSLQRCAAAESCLSFSPVSFHALTCTEENCMISCQNVDFRALLSQTVTLRNRFGILLRRKTVMNSLSEVQYVFVKHLQTLQGINMSKFKLL